MAARVNAPDIACQFVISDMLDVDQTLTSAAVRADAGAVTLRERGQPSSATVKSLQFATDTGAIEQFTGMYRVHVVDDSKPVGTFQIELVNPAELAVVIFDIVTLPSDPGIRVCASADGITQVEASAISRSGYRANAWFSNMPVKYLQIQISPTHPDTIGGNTFTFGLTSFSAEAVGELVVDLLTRGIARLFSQRFRTRGTKTGRRPAFFWVRFSQNEILKTYALTTPRGTLLPYVSSCVIQATIRCLMTRTDLICELSRVLGISATESENIVDTVYLSIVGSLQAGETIDIRGFGRFTTRPRRRGSPPARVPFFRPSKQLKQFIRTYSSQAPAAVPEGSR